MANVAPYHEWLVKKDIFGFLRSHLVPFPVFVGIGVVPVKPRTILQRTCPHESSI